MGRDVAFDGGEDGGVFFAGFFEDFEAPAEEEDALCAVDGEGACHYEADSCRD